MAGTCSVASASSPDNCNALGTCEDSSKTTETTCGSCSEVSALSVTACRSVLGTWKHHTWTSAGATWEGPDDPWVEEWHHSTIVAMVAPSAGYKCYDINPSDHEAKCTGSAACVAAFEGKAAELQISSNCPDGCVFTAAPKSPKVVVPHAPAVRKDGWSVKSGACRGPGNEKVNGKYSNSAGANGGRLTQVECAEACEAEAKCAGYAHSTAWCVVYGPGINETGGADWTADTHAAVTITGTKPNEAYICVVKDEANRDMDAAAEFTVHYMLPGAILVNLLI